MGVTMKYGHPLTTLDYMGNGTCWIANRQDEHSTEERISTCSNKENCHISTPFNFRRYVFTLCLPSSFTLCLALLDAKPKYTGSTHGLLVSITEPYHLSYVIFSPFYQIIKHEQIIKKVKSTWWPCKQIVDFLSNIPNNIRTLCTCTSTSLDGQRAKWVIHHVSYC